MKLSTAAVRSSLKAHRNRYIVASALLLTATPAFAIFGMGDIVFDPSNYAEAYTQLKQMIAMVSTMNNQYKAMQAQAKSFSIKGLWQTELGKMKSATVGNTYGETAGFTQALNLNSAVAGVTAWGNTKLGLNGNTDGILSGQTVGSSARLSQLAMVEASDSISPDCLTAVGSYRQARNDSETAQQSLQDTQMDGTTDTNSEVQQLNLLNASQAQQLNEQQAQGALHTCIASQLTVQNMKERNAAAQDLNSTAAVYQMRQTAPHMPENDGDTWNNFLP